MVSGCHAYYINLKSRYFNNFGSRMLIIAYMETSLEIRIYKRFAQMRTSFLRPLLKILDLLKINPDILSWTGLFLMVVFVFVIKDHPIAGFWLIVMRMLLDGVDGPLARYQKTNSDRGKYTDVMVDQLSFALYIIGIVRLGLVDPLPGLLFLYFTVIVTLQLIIKKSLHRDSDWLIYAQAGGFPYILIDASYVLFGVYAFTFHNYLNSSSKIFAAALVMKAIFDYFVIRTTVFKR